MSYISPKAVVRESGIHGRGLFALEAFGRDEIVVVKGGHIFDRSVLREVEPVLGPAEIQIGADLFIGPLAQDEREGSMIFSNHSCEPNIGVRGQIVFVAMRDIEAGEELTHDWATTDDDTYRMECRCGAPTCRKIITGQDWRRKDLQ
ncbi:MAG TPA: SET domain-containing protein-lysine N-methyltransferase, partial [Pyrinomonadaceae bacterium]